MGRSRPHLCATIASVPVLLVIGGLSMAQDFDSGPRNRLLLPELSKRSSLESRACGGTQATRGRHESDCAGTVAG